MKKDLRKQIFFHFFFFYPFFLRSSSYYPTYLTSVRRIHGKRISDAELTIITNLTNLFPIKNDNYWLKIGKIGNYCQLKTACCLPYRNSSNSRYLVHTYSIDTPSKLWSIYGVCMEYLRKKGLEI